MRLVRAELRRLYKRQVTRWMFAIVVLILGLIAVTTWFTNVRTEPEVLAAAEAEAQANFEEQLRWFRETVSRDIEACEASQAAGDGEWPPDVDCQELLGHEPRREDFQASWYLPPTFDFAEKFPELIQVFAGLFGLFAFAVGASFVGAEWRSGGMMNLLLWRPRRVQVFSAKLGALLAALLGLGVLLGGVWTLLGWLIGSFRGVTDTTTAEVWQSLGLAWARGLTLVLVGGALGYGLASLGRHTAMALGAAVTAVVVGVPGVLIVGAVAGLRYLEAWLWPTYLIAWLDKSVTLFDYRSCEFTAGACAPATLEITWQVAGLGMGALVGLVVGAALWHMSRRDVT